MLKRILVVVVVGVAAFLTFAATRPANYKIERAVTTSAPASVVYAHVADFAKWAEWSPWAKLDPAMKSTLSGSPSSPGQRTTWAGNDKVGEGSMTMTAVKPDEKVEISLEFLRPFKDHSLTTLSLAPDGAGTRITWSMTGERAFMGKVACIFMDMDKLVGSDFEKGLSALKAVAETDAQRAQAQAPGAAPLAQ